MMIKCDTQNSYIQRKLNTTLSVMTFRTTIRKCDTQHNDIQHNDEKNVTLSIMKFSTATRKCDTQQNDIQYNNNKMRHSALQIENMILRIMKLSTITINAYAECR
jgi:hypothetical protein